MQLHPLLTKNQNKHYDKNGRSTIFEIEKELTVTEMIGVCKFSIYKYNSRDKNQDKTDAIKASKYNDYLKELNIIPKRLKDTTVRRAWKNLNKEWSYNA
jgi:hypothetical protein